MTAQSSAPALRVPVGKPLIIALWAAQVVLFAFYVFSGFTKLTTPLPDLSQMMPWTGDVPAAFVRVIGLVDLAGGLGILLPMLTRILPRLTVLAALGCTVLQVFALVFHGARGEFFMFPVNLAALALSAFVLWGRYRTMIKG
jgi:uncharacterized membrane protein YphA (DoxX/SURF4 family)